MQTHNRFYSNIKERLSPYDSSYRPKTTYRENRNTACRTQAFKPDSIISQVYCRFSTNRQRSLADTKKHIYANYRTSKAYNVMEISAIPGKENPQIGNHTTKAAKHIFIRKIKCNSSAQNALEKVYRPTAMLIKEYNNTDALATPYCSTQPQKLSKSFEQDKQPDHVENINKCFVKIDHALVKYDNSIKQLKNSAEPKESEKISTLNNSERPETVLSIGSSAKESVDIDKRPIQLIASKNDNVVTESMKKMKANSVQALVDKANIIKRVLKGHYARKLMKVMKKGKNKKVAAKANSEDLWMKLVIIYNKSRVAVVHDLLATKQKNELSSV